MKSKLFWVITVLVLAGAAVYKFYIDPLLTEMNELHTIEYDKNLTIITGGGGNSGILAGDNMVLVIDTKMAEPSKKLHDMVMQIAGKKPVVVVNTHIHPDHVSGNWFYKGSKIYANRNYSKEFWITEASENSLPSYWVKDQTDIKVGDETVTLLSMPYSIHTKGDLVVYLHNRKLLFSGDIILDKQAPALMKKSGADVNGYFKAFDELPNKFEIQKIVPGHGDIGGSELIENFRRYFVDMKEASSDPSKEKEMKEKYKEWRQVPVIMSNDSTIKFMREEPAK